MTRIIGTALALVGLAILIGDLSGGAVRFRALGEVWYALSPGTLNLTQAVIERYVAVWLWNPVMLTVVLWPAAAVFVGAGALAAAAGELVSRRRGR